MFLDKRLKLWDLHTLQTSDPVKSLNYKRKLDYQWKIPFENIETWTS